MDSINFSVQIVAANRDVKILKNFPHQFNDLAKLTAALNVAKIELGAGTDIADDGQFGEALARAGVYTFRNKGLNVLQNLVAEKKKPVASQGFRTAARDIRRFFHLSSLLNSQLHLTKLGNDIVASAGSPALRNALWREAMLQMALPDANGLHVSHPYRILLRLVADVPSLDTRNLLLIFVAADDSDAEYQRILSLAKLPAEDIVVALRISKSSARNAVKILPAIAEQVGDIVRQNSFTFLREKFATTEDSVAQSIVTEFERTELVEPKAVTPNEIARSPRFKPTQTTIVDLTASIEILRRRTKAHQEIVVGIAAELSKVGYKIFENPYDCLGFKEARGGILVEAKTLEGSRSDERSQTERALGQLKSYSYFSVPSTLASPRLSEVVAYSDQPTRETVQFMNHNAIHAVWRVGQSWLLASPGKEFGPFVPDNLL